MTQEGRTVHSTPKPPRRCFEHEHDHTTLTATGEYKYQIGCQVDYDPNKPETPMLIMEMERVVRNLPQTITGETPRAMPTRVKVRLWGLQTVGSWSSFKTPQ